LEQNHIFFTVVNSPLSSSNNMAITKITYQYNNPTCYSSFWLHFTLPRDQYITEDFMFDLGNDINDLNTNKDKLQLSICDETNNKILRSVILYNSTLKLWKVNLVDGLLTKGSYNLSINGVLIPGSNNNSDIKVLFIRKSDGTLVLSNINLTTAAFPALSKVVSSKITLIDAKFLLEGTKMELVFEVTMFSSDINSETLMYIYFPFYYTRD